MPSRLQDFQTARFLPLKIVKVIGLPITVTTYDDVIAWVKAIARKADRTYAVEAANTHVAALARHDDSFGQAMAQFDLITPDGMPLVWSMNRQLEEKDKLKDRVYGPTLMLKTIDATQGQPELKHFLFGGKQSTLDKLQKRFAKDFLDTTTAGAYPTFGDWPDAKIAESGNLARGGILNEDIDQLAAGISLYHASQLEEGMQPLADIKGAVARKYCGGGHGGYALYLFANEDSREKAVLENKDSSTIEPYLK